MSFQIIALSEKPFEHLFSLSDEELKTRNARREIVRSKPGTPCRISLADAEVGEEVLAVNYEHQSEDTPYKASHAIFIRKDVLQACPKIDEIPTLFNHRLMSVRAFNAEHMMVNADVVEGIYLKTSIDEMFADPVVTYIHLHNAKPGCYAACVRRVD